MFLYFKSTRAITLTAKQEGNKTLLNAVYRGSFNKFQALKNL